MVHFDPEGKSAFAPTSRARPLHRALAGFPFAGEKRLAFRPPVEHTANASTDIRVCRGAAKAAMSSQRPAPTYQVR